MGLLGSSRLLAAPLGPSRRPWAPLDAARLLAGRLGRSSAQARAKFIVPAEVDRDEMFARLLGYARAGAAQHAAATAAAAAGVGAALGTLLVRADAEALAARLREVGGAEAMGGYARIRDALTTYAERVDAAAAALPQPQAAAASR